MHLARDDGPGDEREESIVRERGGGGTYDANGKRLSDPAIFFN